MQSQRALPPGPALCGGRVDLGIGTMYNVDLGTLTMYVTTGYTYKTYNLGCT